MKHIKLVVLSIAALAFGRPAGFSTANSAAEAAEDNSPLALQCKGAGVKPEDVRWRVQAGLDLDQAVQAAIAQKAEDERAASVKKKK